VSTGIVDFKEGVLLEFLLMNTHVTG